MVEHVSDDRVDQVGRIGQEVKRSLGNGNLESEYYGPSEFSTP